jgi:hypothetical protein
VGVTPAICLDLFSPQHCAVDARQPSTLDGTTVFGWNAFRFGLLDGCSLAAGTVNDFVVTETGGGKPPEVISFGPDGILITARLNRPITPGEWTCLTYLPRDETACLGFLPGDVNGDRTTSATDILAIINNINGLPPTLRLTQCDIDRSVDCNAADILRLIDLLNGASAFDPWLGRSLPPCPSAP